MEKFGGVRLLSTEERVSRGSQVSDRDSMSSLWSRIVSWMEVGLSNLGCDRCSGPDVQMGEIKRSKRNRARIYFNVTGKEKDQTE